MSDRLSLKDISALPDFGGKIKDLQSQALDCITANRRILAGELEWLEEKVTYASRKMDEAQAWVDAARAALEACERSGEYDEDGHYRPPDCSSERAELRAAEAELALWTDRYHQARSFQRRFEQEAEEYRRQESSLYQQVTAGTDEALRELGRLTNGYQQTAEAARNVSSGHHVVIPAAIPFDPGSLSSSALSRQGTHGTMFEKAKRSFFVRSLYHPNVPRHIKGWITQEIRRAGFRGRWRNPPGHDVGHITPGIDHPDNFRWETSDMNRSAGARAEYRMWRRNLLARRRRSR